MWKPLQGRYTSPRCLFHQWLFLPHQSPLDNSRPLTFECSCWCSVAACSCVEFGVWRQMLACLWDVVANSWSWCWNWKDAGATHERCQRMESVVLCSWRTLCIYVCMYVLTFSLSSWLVFSCDTRLSPWWLLLGCWDQGTEWLLCAGGNAVAGQ